MKLGLIKPLSPSETKRLRPLQEKENNCEGKSVECSKKAFRNVRNWPTVKDFELQAVERWMNRVSLRSFTVGWEFMKINSGNYRFDSSIEQQTVVQQGECFIDRSSCKFDSNFHGDWIIRWMNYARRFAQLRKSEAMKSES